MKWNFSIEGWFIFTTWLCLLMGMCRLMFPLTSEQFINMIVVVTVAYFFLWILYIRWRRPTGRSR